MVDLTEQEIIISDLLEALLRAYLYISKESSMFFDPDGQKAAMEMIKKAIKAADKNNSIIWPS